MTLDIRTGSLLPGIAVAGFPAAAPPHRLLATGTLLLSGVTPGTRIDLGRHQQMWGLLPTPDLDRLVGAAEWAGVMGAGGAGVPDRPQARLGGGDQGTGDRQRFRGGVRQR